MSGRGSLLEGGERVEKVTTGRVVGLECKEFKTMCVTCVTVRLLDGYNSLYRVLVHLIVVKSLTTTIVLFRKSPDSVFPPILFPNI